MKSLYVCRLTSLSLPLLHLALKDLRAKPYIEVYERMSKAGAIDNYILPYYDTLHTESRECVLDDVMEYIENQERSKIC